MINLKVNKQYICCFKYDVRDIIPSVANNPEPIISTSERFYEIVKQESETTYYVKILDSGANIFNKGYDTINILNFDYIMERDNYGIKIWDKTIEYRKQKVKRILK